MVSNQKLGKPIGSGKGRLPSLETQLHHGLAVYSWASAFTLCHSPHSCHMGLTVPSSEQGGRSKGVTVDDRASCHSLAPTLYYQLYLGLQWQGPEPGWEVTDTRAS